ncbi:ankyrin repeat-containing domain protein [Trichoderma velutinum]
MEQHPSNATEPAQVCLDFDVFDMVLTRYMDKNRDILNFCLANKEYYGLYIGTLYRHNVRYDGSSALEWAAKRDRLSLVSTVLDVPQVEVFAPKDIWHKVLSIAQRQDNMRLAELLFERQLVQNLIRIAAASKAGRGVYRLDETTPLDDQESLLQPMFEAAKMGQQRLIELYLFHVSVDLHNGDGLTALHYAVNERQQDLAIFLLEEHGANPDIHGPDVYRPIDMAALSNLPRLVELLLSKGVDPRSNGGDFSLSFQVAAMLGHGSVVKVLLQDHRIDPCVRNEDGKSPLEYAVISSGPRAAECTGILLDDDRIDPNERNGRGETPLGLAVYHCKDEMIRLLLDDDRVDPNGRHVDGMTPLLVASSSPERQSLNILNMLLEEPRVDVSARDDDGCNACALAAKHGILHTVKALLLNPHIDPNQEDNDKKTPAMYAAAGYQAEGEATPVYLTKNKHLVLAALIADERVDLNKIDDNGQTAMHWAVAKFRRENVKLLLESGRVNVNQDGSSGHRTLIEACILKNSALTRLLLDSGSVDLSNTNSNGETPLMFAIRKAGRRNRDIEDSIWAILDRERRSRLDLRYGNGLTVLEHAVQVGASGIVRMLLFSGKGVVTPRAMELCADEHIREMLDNHDGNPSMWWISRKWWKRMGVWEPLLFLQME